MLSQRWIIVNINAPLLSASKIGHTCENVNEEMKNSINPRNLDIVGKKINCIFRLYASNLSKSYYFLKSLE